VKANSRAAKFNINPRLLCLTLLLPHRIYYQDANHVMLPVTPQLIERFKAGLTRCFKAALDAGVLPGSEVFQC
jgi:hypothetical protein